MPTFDGPNKIVQLDSAVTSYEAQVDLYSAWKNFVRIGDNAKFLPAFDTTGGDPLGGGQTISGFFFLRNDLGWRIRGPDEALEIQINGDLFPRDSGQPFFAQTNDFITRNVSARSLTNEVGTSGLTPEEAAALLEIKQRMGLDQANPLTITDNSISFGGVTITIAQPDPNTTTVTRQP